MSSSLSASQRDHAIDFLKILGTILVVLHHYTQVCYLSGQGVFFGGTIYFGRCVELFFLIAGYVMYRYQLSIQDHEISLKKFCGKRALRLLPLVAISAIVYEILIMVYRKLTGTLYMGHDLDLSGTLFTSLGIQTGWATKNPTINNPTWFIAVLLLCYLIFYLVNYISGKRKINVNFLYLGMVFLGMGIVSFKINLPFLNNSAGRGYYSFFAGILLANFLALHKSKINKFSIVAIIMILGTVLTVVYNARNDKEFDDYYWLTFVFFPSLIILAETKVAQKLFSADFWSLLAKIAYNVFIWHVCMEIIMNYLLQTVPVFAQQTEWQMMLIVLFLDWIVGFLSYRFIEKPIEAKTDRYFAKML